MSKQVSAIAASRRVERVTQRTIKAAQVAKQSQLPNGSIDPQKTYTRGALLKEFGLGFRWFREAQKNGLTVARAGKMKFVSGSDLIDFIKAGRGQAVTDNSK